MNQKIMNPQLIANNKLIYRFQTKLNLVLFVSSQSEFFFNPPIIIIVKYVWLSYNVLSFALKNIDKKAITLFPGMSIIHFQICFTSLQSIQKYVLVKYNYRSTDYVTVSS